MNVDNTSRMIGDALYRVEEHIRIESSNNYNELFRHTVFAKLHQIVWKGSNIIKLATIQNGNKENMGYP